MTTKKKVDQERLDERRGVLGKIPGAERKAWVLEVYELRDGQDYLAETTDIRTGQPVRRRQEQENKRQEAPG